VSRDVSFELSNKLFLSHLHKSQLKETAFLVLLWSKLKGLWLCKFKNMKHDQHTTSHLQSTDGTEGTPQKCHDIFLFYFRVMQLQELHCSLQFGWLPYKVGKMDCSARVPRLQSSKFFYAVPNHAWKLKLKTTFPFQISLPIWPNHQKNETLKCHTEYIYSMQVV
jgi:hypothetical protein